MDSPKVVEKEFWCSKSGWFGMPSWFESWILSCEIDPSTDKTVNSNTMGRIHRIELNFFGGIYQEWMDLFTASTFQFGFGILLVAMGILPMFKLFLWGPTLKEKEWLDTKYRIQGEKEEEETWAEYVASEDISSLSKKDIQSSKPGVRGKDKKVE